MMKKTIIFLFIFGSMVSCTQEEEKIIHQGPIFGSSFAIVYYGKDDYKSSIDSIFKKFDDIFSTYKPNSEISRFNQSPNGLEKVSPEFLELFKRCKELNGITLGYVDPTVQPLISFWKVEDPKDRAKIDTTQISEIMRWVGMNHIKIEGEGLVKSNPQVQLNYNAVAAWCNDWVADFLDKKGVDNYMIQIAGEIRVKGTKEQNQPWVLGIDDPNYPDESRVLKRIKLKNQSMATSGNYRKFYVNENGVKITHTINPKTGQSRESNIISATVLADDALTADAYATALMAAGMVDAQRLILKELRTPIMLIISTKKGMEIKYYNGFEENILPDE